MVDLAAGGKDVNSVAVDALGLLVKSPGVAILLSTFAKMTLDIMQTPVKEFFEEGTREGIKMINVRKFEGMENFEGWLKYHIGNTFSFPKNYFFNYISCLGMQGLLNGSIKNWEQLSKYSKWNEVAILCIEEDDYTIIDSFFVNTEKNRL